MPIIRFDPFALQRQMLQPLMRDGELWPEVTMTHGLNVYEEGSHVVVEAPMPGIPEDKIEITYEDGVLHISGKHEVHDESKEKNRVIHRMERVSSFDYTTYVPRPIDQKGIEAVIENGVLVIKAPIAEEAKPKRIPVTAKKK